ARPVAIYPSRSSPEIRSPGARPRRKASSGSRTHSDCVRCWPKVRHARRSRRSPRPRCTEMAPGRRRHLQAVKDPRALQRCSHRGALCALAEGGPGGREPAGPDPRRSKRRGRKCRANVGTSWRPSMTATSHLRRVHKMLAPIVFITQHISRFFAYTWGMSKTLDGYLDERLGRGRGYLTKAEAMKTLGLSSTAFAAAAARLTRQRRLATPKQGFYLILRPEDQSSGGPDPARWIDPIMHHLGLDYRISLLRAAAFHGASHQAAQIFQVIVPKQLRPIAIDRQRLQFVYQAPDAFVAVNKEPWLGQLKTDAGLAKVAGRGPPPL